MNNEYEEYDELPEESADVEAYDPEASSSIGDGVTKSLADGLKGGGAQGGSPTGAAFNAGREGAEKAGGAVGDALGGGVGEAVGKDVSKAAVSAGQVGAGVYSGDVSSITEGGKELLKTNTGKVGAVVSWIAGLFNPASAVVIGVFILILGVVFGGFSVEQTIGKNEHACETNSDCSVAKRIDGCSASGINGGNYNGGAWPQPGSDEAIKATYSLLIQAGLGEMDAYLLTAIAGLESSWNPNAGAGRSYVGLFQMGAGEAQAYGGFSHADMLDPAKAATAVAKMYQARGAQPWAGWPGSNLSILFPSSNPRGAIISSWTNNIVPKVTRVLGGPGFNIGSSGDYDGPITGKHGGGFAAWGVKGAQGDPPYGAGSSSGSSVNAGGDCAGANGTCGPECAKTLQAAKGMIGNCNGWNGLCASFAADAAGWGAWCGPIDASNDGNGSCSAVDGLIQAQRKGVANKITDWNTVPAGALILRGPAGSSIHGHVAVMSDKPGYVITTAAEGAAGSAGDCIKEYPNGAGFDKNIYYWVDPGQLK